MSDPKRATLITVGAPKSAKNSVTKTVRLTINLVESNESKYPELNYKELVIAEEKKKHLENGKTAGLDPFMDNDEDVERVARKFEQKYGGKSTYGKKGRSKNDDFADIGAGYDENDSFIDNTHGYDEMIPPECDTFHGGFYINCGSLEFKTVPENQVPVYDAENNRRNKRRISSSSSEEESSESLSESESQDEKEPKAIANGAVDSHKTEHRKKKNKKIDKKAKKIRRTDSSAATSGKQTSDDNAHHGDGESADSRTSQSDSLTSKPAPSSENAITSDSSRDVEAKLEVQPSSVEQILVELEVQVSRQLAENPGLGARDLENKAEPLLTRLEQALTACMAAARVSRAAWTRAAKSLNTTRDKLLNRSNIDATQAPVAPAPSAATATISHNKRKYEDRTEDLDITRLTEDEREAKIVDTLAKLKTLIEERKPAMIANYNAECERVQEERKKIQIATASGIVPHTEKRLPKRRFPWCPRSRALLARLRLLAGTQEAAAVLLANRALPLFPKGFVRMPTLLRQADLSKEMKVTDVKRPRQGSFTQHPATVQVSNQQVNQFIEPIHFPSSLTVTTMKSDTNEIAIGTDDKDTKKPNVFNSLLNSLSIQVDKSEERKDEKKDDLYIPPNNIGSITITPVVSEKMDKSKKEPLIRVKSPAALNEMVKKDKKKDKNPKERSVETPLHIETNCVSSKKNPSPKSKDEVTQKQLETMRINENNLPRPGLVPVHHSPTFAKPDKRPPEVKKKKDVVIVSDVDPLGDIQSEPVAIDDSSSDVEVVEEKTDKSNNCVSDVPSKDNSEVNSDKHLSNRVKKDKDVKEQNHEAIIDSVMKNLREMKHSQDSARVNAFGEVLANEQNS